MSEPDELAPPFDEQAALARMQRVHREFGWSGSIGSVDGSWCLHTMSKLVAELIRVRLRAQHYREQFRQLEGGQSLLPLQHQSNPVGHADNTTPQNEKN